MAKTRANHTLHVITRYLKTSFFLVFQNAKGFMHILIRFYLFMILLHLEIFASRAEGLSFYNSGSFPVKSTFARVGYSISRDRHEEWALSELQLRSKGQRADKRTFYHWHQC